MSLITLAGFPPHEDYHPLWLINNCTSPEQYIEIKMDTILHCSHFKIKIFNSVLHFRVPYN